MKKYADLILKNLTIPLGLLSVLICFVLQQTPGLFEIGGVKPILILPAVFALAATSKSPTLSGIAGLFFGLGWELLAGRFTGYLALLLMSGAVFMSVYWRRENLTTVNFILHTTFACALLTVGDLLVFEYLLGYGSPLFAFSRHTLPIILYTGIVSPLLYLFCRIPSLILERPYHDLEEWDDD